MKNVEVKINRSVLGFSMIIFIIFQTLAYTRFTSDLFGYVKSLITFIYCFILIILICATDVFKDIKKKELIIPTVCIGLIVLFNIISTVISPLYGVDTKTNEYLIFGVFGRENGITFWAANLIFFIGGFLIAIDKKNLDRLVSAIIFVSTIVSLDSLIQYFSGNEFLMLGVNNLKKLRFSVSTLGNENYLAVFIIITIFFSLYRFLKTDDKSKFIYILCFIIQFSSLLSTRIIYGFIAAGLGILYICFSNRKQFLGMLVVIVISLICLGIFSFITKGGIYSEKSLNQITTAKEIVKAGYSDNLKLSQKKLLWKKTIDIIKERPVIGWGSNSFYVLRYNKNINVPEKIRGDINTIKIKCIYSDRPFNEYLGIIQSCGLITFAIYIVFLIYIIIKCLKNKVNQYRIPVTAMLIAYSFYMLFSFSLLSYSILVFLLLGAAVSSEENQLNKREVNNGK